MPIRLRRLSRSATPKAPATEPVGDPRLARSLKHLLRAERDRVLPSDRDLDRLADVQDIDIQRAESLWDEAQRRAGTGLDGLLSAKTDEGNA